MSYIELQCTCDNQDLVSILIAELEVLGYEAFWEDDEGFKGYITSDQFKKHELELVSEKHKSKANIVLSYTTLEDKNWNEAWEKDYKPVIINDQCAIISSFHQLEKRYPYEIIINPKMSFGTGHHATTTLVGNEQLYINHHKKRVLDIGTGTGILAILAELLGASEVNACDIDEWSYENAQENISLNKCSHITLEKGTLQQTSFSATFDIVLANINRNVLLKEISLYTKFMHTDSLLILSGFYEFDNDIIVKKAQECGLSTIRNNSKDHWSCITLKK